MLVYILFPVFVWLWNARIKRFRDMAWGDLHLVHMEPSVPACRPPGTPADFGRYVCSVHCTYCPCEIREWEGNKKNLEPSKLPVIGWC